MTWSNDQFNYVTGKLRQLRNAEENHYKWVYIEVSRHSIRVNAAMAGEHNEQLELAADGLSRISEFAAKTT